MRLENNIVSTATEYFQKCNEEIDWDETGDPNLISMREYNMVGQIIATQVSFWCLRRLSNSCESNCDYMRDIMKSKISEYELDYGKFIDFNEENIW
jgi:hypothetical protein